MNQTFQITGIPFTVVGTFKEAVDTLGQTEVADQTILIPYSVARYFTGTNDIKKIFFSIRDSGDVELATKQILKCHSVAAPAQLGVRCTDADGVLSTAASIANCVTWSCCWSRR